MLLQAQIISQWNLNNTVTDNNNGANNGVNPNNAVTFAAGQENQAGVFNGSSSYISINPTAFNFGTTSFTVSAWVTITPGTSQTFISKGINTSTNLQGWAMFYDNATHGIHTNLYNGATGVAKQLYSKAMNINNGNFHYIVTTVTQDLATIDNNIMHTYIDAVLRDSVLLSATGLPVQTADSVRIGTRILNGALGGYANGKIDQPRITQGILTQKQITEEYMLRTGKGFHQ